MSTPHNQAEKGQIAETVLMPGDPLRAKFIAETFLKDPVLFNSVRGMLGYTGTYEGVPVSVMASGMGMPSIGIYSYELYKFYDVKNIIRVGSAGAYTAKLKLFDVVLASGSYSESSYAKTQSGDTETIQRPSEELNRAIEKAAGELQMPLQIGIIHSSDVFYQERSADDSQELIEKYGVLAAEMESFALFHNANVLHRNAACLLTISDSLVTHEETTSEQRQNSFTAMMKIALRTAADLKR